MITHSAPVTLYAYTFRSRAERVLWTLQELGISHTLVRLDPFKGETLTPEFTRLNPLHKIPVLVHGDKVLTESLAIMEYLNDIAEGKLVPDGIDDYYRFRHLMYYLATEVEPYLWLADQDSRLKKLYQWPQGTGEEAVKRVEKALPHLLDCLSQGEFACGSQFTLADMYAYQLLTWAESYDMKPNEKVQHYLSRLNARPAFPESMRSNGGK